MFWFAFGIKSKYRKFADLGIKDVWKRQRVNKSAVDGDKKIEDNVYCSKTEASVSKRN